MAQQQIVKKLANILVVTDFSACSIPAVEQGQDLAAASGATVHLLHVVSEPVQEVWAAYAPGVNFIEMVDRMQRDAVSRLDGLARPGLKTAKRVVVAAVWGDPFEQILEYAAHHAIDLIVCGTHGRRGWNRLMMGSVAERLVRLAPCPVLTIRADRAEQVAA